MIRKAIIVVLTLGAIVATALGAASYSVGAYLMRRPTRHLLIEFEVSRGWLCIEILTSSDASLLNIYDELRQGFCEPDADVSACRGHSPAWYGDPIWGNNQIGIAGTSQNRQCLNLFVSSFFLAAYPTIAFIRGPFRRWRRHRKGLCLRCGYNLEGNVSGVCSECGEAR